MNDEKKFDCSVGVEQDCEQLESHQEEPEHLNDEHKIECSVCGNIGGGCEHAKKPRVNLGICLRQSAPAMPDGPERYECGRAEADQAERA